MAESSSEPSAAPAIPTNKPWLLKPKYPGPSAFFYAYLPEDEYYMVGGTDNDPSVRSECEYYGGRQALLNIVEQTFLELNPRIYQSMKAAKSYIFKREILNQMQMLTMNANFRMTQDNVPILRMMAIYMRTKDEMMEGNLEFVPYDEDKLAVFQKHVTDRFRLARHTGRKFKITQKKQKTIEYVFETIKAMMPVNKYDPEFTSLRKVLIISHEERPVHNNHTFYDYLINMMYIITVEFNNFINNNKSWFTPYPVVQGPKTAFVRLFKEEKNSYVLGFELLREMKRCEMDTVQLEEILQDKRPMYCLDIRIVLSLKLQNLELVVSKNLKAFKTPIWIPLVDGTFCLQAEDMIQFFVYRIHNAKYFQNASTEKRDKILGAFSFIKTTLEDLEKGYRLVLQSDVEKIKDGILEYFKNNKISPPAEKIEVRQIDEGLWTENNLAEEIKHLKLDEPFPDMVKFAENVFKFEKLEHFRTLDLCSAVEICQFFCITRVDENTRTFYELEDSWFEEMSSEVPGLADFKAEPKDSKAASEAAPKKSEATPKESEAKSVDSEVAPAAHEATPTEADSEKKPKDSEAASMDSKVTPADSEAAPANSEAEKADSEVSPKDVGAAPADSGAASKESEPAQAAPADD
ncbi:Protein CBG10521 [Caenorhabditis briggsae]|uniref:Protein CBG10521 n=1 Tax=Caenorhabditis briggsae TaxID=6238 RepID=A8XB02_CAEBR|nr:Protein CBG10521 [Caenorhabditis briggsae]CAP29930.2 Protein CBG10521 [Caenorhabditis briggsae]